ncbi:MAG: hypothetical protein OIF34_13315 [Porticoccaceae bacterium]|nr:hypothetical protein [Porticoccaceae bacterium]
MIAHWRCIPALGLAVFALSACQLPAQDNPAPARLVATDQQTALHPLTGLISEMLNGVAVTLADDAFYNNNEVIIEGPRMGRTFEKPHHFRLWLEDGNCLLEHVESGRKRLVKSVACHTARRVD